MKIVEHVLGEKLSQLCSDSSNEATWSSAEPPPHHHQEPSNLCQSDDAKQPFVVELGNSTRPLLISTATADPSKVLPT